MKKQKLPTRSTINDGLPVNRKYEKKIIKQGVKDLVTGYLDWNDDGKVGAGDIVKEAASWMVGGPIAKFGLRGLGKGYKFVKVALKRESSSPFNHCDSEMMHSGGWGQVRKYNSPGTIGNKEGIKHNEQMRKEIGTFKMPHHSPLNKGHEVNQDSIASVKAWKEHKAGYLKKEGGQKEYDMEKGEFYYSPKHKKLRLIPTDDGEVQDRSGIEDWQLAPDRKSSMSPLNKEGKKDACYHKVKSRVKVWPSAYASGQLVQCRKAGAANWGEKSKKK